MLLLGGMLYLGGSKASAAETQIMPSANMTTAPEIAVGTTYYAVMNNNIGYVSFVTPAQGGYVTVYYKNISLGSASHAYVKTALGEELHHFDWVSNGNDSSVEFLSESGKAHSATLEPGTRYYIQVGGEDRTGNVLFSVTFAEDVNPNGNDQPEIISLNTPYTRSIDASNNTDTDYFKFTTTTGGAARIVISKTASGGLNYNVRKCATLELAKDSKGYDIIDDFYGSSTEIDAVFEPNTEYFLAIWRQGKTSYTFSINNQSVTSITMPSERSLAAGETFNLGAAAYPDNAYNRSINYSSSNEYIASVDREGNVRASSNNCGVAIITASAADVGGATATCRVVVTPSKPSSPSVAKYTKNSIKISWSALSGVGGYEVYRKSGKSWKKVKTTTGTTYTDKKLKSGHKYQYRIRTYVNLNASIFHSPYSDTCYAATQTGATKITSVSKGAKSKGYWSTTYRATLRWKKVKGATGYAVYYRTPGYSSKYSVGLTTNTRYKVSASISNGYTKKRYFYVTPYIKTGGNYYYGKISKSRQYKYH